MRNPGFVRSRVVGCDLTIKRPRSLYHGHGFPVGIISSALRRYFRFQLSLRDIEKLLVDRGVIVTY